MATMGKFAGPPARVAIFTRSGGDASGPTQERPRKPQVQISKVKYHNLSTKKVTVIGIQEN